MSRLQRSNIRFQFPLPTNSDPKKSGLLFSLQPYKTVGEVIGDLGQPYKLNGHIPEDSHLDVTPQGDRFRIQGVGEGSHLACEVHLPIEQRKNLTKKDTTKFKRLSRTQPSNTLRCGEIFFHPLEDRYLTPREYLRIHGYPNDYILRGPIRGRSGRVRFLDQHRQVANSVPPPVAKALATAIELGLSNVFSGPISANGKDAKPSFSDMIRTPMLPPIKSLILRLAERKPINQIVVK